MYTTQETNLKGIRSRQSINIMLVSVFVALLFVFSGCVADTETSGKQSNTASAARVSGPIATRISPTATPLSIATPSPSPKAAIKSQPALKATIESQPALKATIESQPTLKAIIESQPALKATIESQPVSNRPTPRPANIGVNNNPWGYDFTAGELIYSPPEGFCGYFSCIPNFWNGRGYVEECQDGMYSKSGGIRGSCFHHGGNLRPLYSH